HQSLLPEWMHVFDDRVLGEAPDTSLLGHGHDLVIDEPMPIAFVGDHTWTVPARALLLDVGATDQRMAGVLTGDHARIAEVIGTHHVLAHLLGGLQPPRMELDVVADE